MKKQKLFHDRKYLYELLYFDWIEVELYMKEYKEKEVLEFSWENSYSLALSARIKKFDFDIINANHEEKRENYLIIYYDFKSDEVIYREINQFIYVLISRLKEDSLENILKQLCSENDIEFKDAKEILEEALKELIVNKALNIN